MTQAVTLDCGARQQFALSARLQQAIRLLQMSSERFEQEVQQALVSNPFLRDTRLDDDLAEPSDEPTSAAMPADIDVLTPMLTTYDGASRDWDHDDRPMTTLPGDNRSLHRDEGADDGDDAVQRLSRAAGLREHLRDQALASALPVRIHLALEMLIDSIDDDGYLRDDTALLAASLSDELGLKPALSRAELDTAHHALRGFEPAGVGARDLVDCLCLQIDASDAPLPRRELARRLLCDGLDLLLRRDFVQLRQRFDRSRVDLLAAYDLIRRLDPKPGERYSIPSAHIVTPDVIVQIEQGHPQVRCNPALRAHAALDRRMSELYQRVRRGGDGVPQLARQLQEARWLLRNIEQRFVTIRRVADAIVDRQPMFFIDGDVALMPLTLKDISESLGLHESTVSRATANKYMQTPRGTVHFKHFFQRPLVQHDGGIRSAASVRALMQSLIDREDANAPLSDVSLAAVLGQRGVKVARRTIAKYRTMMRVLPADLRRQKS